VRKQPAAAGETADEDVPQVETQTYWNRRRSSVVGRQPRPDSWSENRTRAVVWRGSTFV